MLRPRGRRAAPGSARHPESPRGSRSGRSGRLPAGGLAGCEASRHGGEDTTPLGVSSGLPMERHHLHTFQLVVEGLAEPREFLMPFETDDVIQATDACSRYIARQEDNFLPLGAEEAVRANRILLVRHLSVAPFQE